MEPNINRKPETDDLPLRANTNHVLVWHYVLDLTVNFDRRAIGGSIVLFLKACVGGKNKVDDDIGAHEHAEAGWSRDGLVSQTATDREIIQSSHFWQTTSNGDFTLVLDCCDIDVTKVEEVDISSVLATVDLHSKIASEGSPVITGNPQADFIQKLISMPANQWKQQHQLFSLCSQAPGAEEGSSLHFQRDLWSLQIRKTGVKSPEDFPGVVRICYETKPSGGSVRWTEDQDKRVCVYTAGSPINNRALFPCQEPPVAMSTWQAKVRAPFECVVLMSGEEVAEPTTDGDTNFLIWNYYITMAMPASTLTLAVGHWHQVTAQIPSTVERRKKDNTDCGNRAKPRDETQEWTETEVASGLGNAIDEAVKFSSLQTGSRDWNTCSDSSFRCSSLEAADFSDVVHDGIYCSHGDYPCRFTMRSAWTQRVIPHRVFSPLCLLEKAQMVLKLLPQCLDAAHTVLGVHPFPRLDVVIVPAGFSSLGMASPHIIFLSQSVLHTSKLSPDDNSHSLCGSRICHEIAHSWFGLAIGARDWTEEWISEGFATWLEDIIWAHIQQLSLEETIQQFDLKALLRWRRLSDELQNSNQELHILRPNMSTTGEVSDSGSSTVKHALNPEKSFMQVHYLKGYFLLRFLASQVGEQQFIEFFRLFVKKYHGQLILSQDFLQMLLITFPDIERKGLTLNDIYADWLDRAGIPEWVDERSAVWSQTKLVEEVKAEVVKWILLSQSHQGKGRKRKRIDCKVNYKELTSDQLVLLLELLLDEPELSAESMRMLQKIYHLQMCDAEVRHRWCELVVKYAYVQAYGDVEHFLVHDQAMGVYLYGELMIQEDPKQQALARRCLLLVQEEMDQSARTVVKEMVL